MGFWGRLRALRSRSCCCSCGCCCCCCCLSRPVKATIPTSRSRRTSTQGVSPSCCSFFRHGHWPFQVKHTLFPPLLLLLLPLQIRQGNNPNFQFKTHPNIDKAGYSNGVLGLKDPSRPFPTGVIKFVWVTCFSSKAKMGAWCPSASTHGPLGAVSSDIRRRKVAELLHWYGLQAAAQPPLLAQHIAAPLLERNPSPFAGSLVVNAGSKLEVLTWRCHSRDENLVPLSINTWPSIPVSSDMAPIFYATPDLLYTLRQGWSAI